MWLQKYSGEQEYWKIKGLTINFTIFKYKIGHESKQIDCTYVMHWKHKSLSLMYHQIGVWLSTNLSFFLVCS